jgi:hypothetical protein
MSWKLEARVYGEGAASTDLYEEDGALNPKMNRVTLMWSAVGKSGSVKRADNRLSPQYEVELWRLVSEHRQSDQESS